MSGYKIRFNGLDRLYSRYKTEFDEIAQKSWKQGQAILGEETSIVTGKQIGRAHV